MRFLAKVNGMVNHRGNSCKRVWEDESQGVMLLFTEHTDICCWSANEYDSRFIKSLGNSYKYKMNRKENM